MQLSVDRCSDYTRARRGVERPPEGGETCLLAVAAIAFCISAGLCPL
jgi:hypothetical protein